MAGADVSRRISRVERMIRHEMCIRDRRNGVSASGFDDGFPQTLQEALALADEIDAEDVSFIWDGINMNYRVADGGFKTQEECSSCGACLQSLSLIHI